MHLTYRFCDDWLIFAQATDRSWWTTCTETWPEWLDAAEAAGLDATDHNAVDRLATAPDAVQVHMVMRVSAWDTELSPTASPVSSPTGAGLQGASACHCGGVIGFAAWQRLPESQYPDLEAFARQRQ